MIFEDFVTREAVARRELTYSTYAVIRNMQTDHHEYASLIRGEYSSSMSEFSNLILSSLPPKGAVDWIKLGLTAIS